MENYRYIVNVQGISGAGKSTRLYMLLKFFEEELKYSLKEYMVKSPKTGKDRPCGILVEELNLVVLGKFYTKDNIHRFQGFDAVTGILGKAALWSEFIKERPDLSFIVEGAGITNSFRYRPKFLVEEIGNFNNILTLIYNYSEDQKEDYLDRIVYRSGKRPNKDSMWSKRIGFERMNEMSNEEIEELRLNPDNKGIIMYSEYNNWDSPLWDLGATFFKRIYNSMEVSQRFIDYCKKSNYVETNKYNGE